MVSGGSGWGSGGRGRGEEVALATDLRQGVDAFVNYLRLRLAFPGRRSFSLGLSVNGRAQVLGLTFARWRNFCRL